MPPRKFDDGPVIAIADLCGRSGARSFEIGYLYDDVPSELAGWWASVQYQGAKLIVDDQPSAGHACDGLAHKLLDGGRCTHCGKRTTTAQTPLGTYLHGARAVDACVWHRDGRVWKRGCE